MKATLLAVAGLIAAFIPSAVEAHSIQKLKAARKAHRAQRNTHHDISLLESKAAAKGPADQMFDFINGSVTRYQNELSVLETSHKAEVEPLEAQSNSLREELAKVEGELAANQTEIEGIAQKVKESEDRLNSANADLPGLEHEISSLKDEIERGDAKREASRQQYLARIAENLQTKEALTAILEVLKGGGDLSLLETKVQGNSAAAALLQKLKSAKGTQEDFIAVFSQLCGKMIEDVDATITQDRLDNQEEENKYLAPEGERNALTHKLKGAEEAAAQVKNTIKAETDNLEKFKTRTDELNKANEELLPRIKEQREGVEVVTNEISSKNEHFNREKERLDKNVADAEKMVALVKKNMEAFSALIPKEIAENLEVAAWEVGAWGQCSAECGQGVQTRTVTCSSKDKECPAEKPADSQPCFVKECPIDCQVLPDEEAELVSTCDGKCGKGKEVFKRRVTVEPQFGGKACPELEFTRECVNKCFGFIENAGFCLGTVNPVAGAPVHLVRCDGDSSSLEFSLDQDASRLRFGEGDDEVCLARSNEGGQNLLRLLKCNEDGTQAFKVDEHHVQQENFCLQRLGESVTPGAFDTALNECPAEADSSFKFDFVGEEDLENKVAEYSGEYAEYNGSSF